MAEQAAYPNGARHGQVVHELGRQIVRGVFAPGQLVPTEEQLVAEFGLGRSALREGVKVLAGKGLIETRTSAGTRVRPRESWNLLDPDVLRWRFAAPVGGQDIAALADFRVAFEPGAARLAAEARTPAGLQQIEAAMAALWATADEPGAFIKADLAFHRAVFPAARKPRVRAPTTRPPRPPPPGCPRPPASATTGRPKRPCARSSRWPGPTRWPGAP